MSAYTAWFNRHDLSELFVISPPERNLVTWEPDLVAMPNGYGSLFAGTKAQAMEITLKLTTFAETLEERLDALRTLSNWLFVTEPKKLFLTDERPSIGTLSGYLLRYAVPSGTPKITYALNAATTEVKFICPDARGYSTVNIYDDPPTNAITFSDDGYADVVAAGTAPANVRVRMSNAVGDENGDFEFTITCYNSDQGGGVVPEFGGTITLHDMSTTIPTSVDIDSETRQCAIGGVSMPLPPENDWISIIGGRRTIFQVTKGRALRQSTMPTAGRITYQARWW